MAKPTENDWETTGHVRTLVVQGGPVAGVYLCYRMAVPFLPALTRALALAVVFAPIQRWLESKFKRPDAAAGSRCF